MRALAERVYEQVQIAIAVHVGKDSSCGMPACAADTGRSRHLLDLPASQFAVECVGSVDCTEVKVAPAIAVEIAQRHSRAEHEVVVLHDQPVVETVGEMDSSRGRLECGETGIASIRN